ncbi:hypothetical protein AVEN_245412-1 [Araneus ventricosus]|uniref:Uncharacterized protein n=1 Tax=Araneus ventricosus TaxID=182803 RepID=A0A4Y2LFN7_ARAVE|nr:hypothetical protein AVEN_245412-1 [Araneus ventricosus]
MYALTLQCKYPARIALGSSGVEKTQQKALHHPTAIPSLPFGCIQDKCNSSPANNTRSPSTPPPNPNGGKIRQPNKTQKANTKLPRNHSSRRHRNQSQRLDLPPSSFLQINQISLDDGGPSSLDSTNKVLIFTDGSRTEEGVGAAFCVFSNNQKIFHRTIKLNNYNTVFQAEITALNEAIQHAIANHEQ